MSHAATTWAYRQELDAGPKFVLVALADFADENASCYPGQERIAKMTGLHRSSVVRHMQTLEDLGLITRTRRAGAGGHRTSDRYLLNLAASVAETNVAPSNVGESNVAPDGDQCRNLRGPMSHRATGTVREPSGNRQSGGTTRGTRIPDDFAPSPRSLEWAATKAADVDLGRETEKFVNHWLTSTGKNAVKRDWNRAWQNWMLTAQEWVEERKPTRSPTPARSPWDTAARSPRRGTA